MEEHIILTNKGERFHGTYKLKGGLITIYHNIAFEWTSERKVVYLLNIFPYTYIQRYWRELKDVVNPITIPVNNIDLIVKADNKLKHRRFKK